MFLLIVPMYKISLRVLFRASSSLSTLPLVRSPLGNRKSLLPDGSSPWPIPTCPTHDQIHNLIKTKWSPSEQAAPISDLMGTWTSHWLSSSHTQAPCQVHSHRPTARPPLSLSLSYRWGGHGRSWVDSCPHKGTGHGLQALLPGLIQSKRQPFAAITGLSLLAAHTPPVPFLQLHASWELPLSPVPK